MSKKKKPRYIKPPNLFKQKVGSGGLDDVHLQKGQAYIENTEVDFLPYAKAYLKQLAELTQYARKSNDNFETLREKIAIPVMQLKANGGMFKYRLVSDVADIALQFLDTIDSMNEDALEVLRAHENTLQIIINNKLKGDGGNEGYALVQELDRACKRYFTKHNKGE